MPRQKHCRPISVDGAEAIPKAEQESERIKQGTDSLEITSKCLFKNHTNQKNKDQTFINCLILQFQCFSKFFGQFPIWPESLHPI